MSLSVNVSFIVTQLPHIQFKTALETAPLQAVSLAVLSRWEETFSSPMWRKVELLSLVENQEEPVHYVEDYEHPREGFQKELVNPKIKTF